VSRPINGEKGNSTHHIHFKHALSLPSLPLSTSSSPSRLSFFLHPGGRPGAGRQRLGARKRRPRRVVGVVRGRTPTRRPARPARDGGGSRRGRRHHSISRRRRPTDTPSPTPTPRRRGQGLVQLPRGWPPGRVHAPAGVNDRRHGRGALLRAPQRPHLAQAGPVPGHDLPQDDAQGPDIRFLGHPPPREQFRGRPVKRPFPGHDRRVPGQEAGQADVRELGTVEEKRRGEREKSERLGARAVKGRKKKTPSRKKK